MPRKIKDPSNRLRKFVTFRLDAVSHAALASAAEAHGMTANDLARLVTMKSTGQQTSLPQVKVRAVAAEILGELKVELVRQGTNVNQIARSANQGDRSMLSALPAWFAASMALMNKIADALGTTRDP
jgi:hypothetical protein